MSVYSWYCTLELTNIGREKNLEKSQIFTKSLMKIIYQ